MHAHGRDYMPLDVEIAQNNPALASTAGFKTVEDFEQAQRQEEVNTRKRLLQLTWGTVGSLFVVLVTLAALTTKPYHSINSSTDEAGLSTIPAAAAPAGTAPHEAGMPTTGIWNEGSQGTDVPAHPGPDFVPCKGSRLRCDVVNKLPVPEVDFRNLSRRASSSNGMVAADSSRCSEIGRDVLSQHAGNAIDAAVAVALCQGVVNPVASGLGGGAFIMVRLANGSAEFIDARETAPAAATADMYNGLPRNASIDGALAIAVPGELQGLAHAHSKWGVVPWARLVGPAAALARSGFAAHPYMVYIMSGPTNFRRIQSTPALREAFMIKGLDGQWRLPYVGELCCKRPRLARTLEQVAAMGPSYLTSPTVAAAMAAELSAAGGIITAHDFSTAAPAVREPLRVQVGELELLLPPPPSSAAVVAFALKFLAGYGNTLQSQPAATTAAPAAAATTSNSSAASSSSGSNSNERLGPNGQPLAAFSANAAARDGGLGIHRLVEAMKHGFAVRTALGDPGTPEQPFPHADSINAAVADLLSDNFIDGLRAATRDDGVLPDNVYGGRWNPEGVAPPEEHGTSHFCVVDKDRNAVSITTSINLPFGSGVMSELTGILFGNTMDDFAQPNKSSIVTPHPSEANFIAPGKRPLSAMSPIIVTHKRSGRLVAVAGASGGPLIVSATLQTLARLLLEGVDVSEAVSAPRIHDQLLPTDNTYYENYTWGHTEHELPAEVVGYLKSRGQVPTAGQFALGVSQAIFVSYNESITSVQGTAPNEGSSTTAGAAGTSSSSSSSSSSRTAVGLLLAQSDARKDGAPVGY